MGRVLKKLRSQVPNKPEAKPAATTPAAAPVTQEAPKVAVAASPEAQKQPTAAAPTGEGK